MQVANDNLNIKAGFFKALGHPTRVLIIERLADGEKCVSELTEMIEVDISTVSRHLAVLKNAGILRKVKYGNQVFYALRTPFVLGFLKCIQELHAENCI